MQATLPPSTALVARVVVGVLALLGLGAGPAAADPYPGTVPTSCTVDLDASAAGRDLVATVGVGAPGSSSASGTLTAVFDGPTGQLSSQDVAYDGGKVVIRGPKATDKGRYDVRVTFVPRSGSVFTKCADTDGVDVGVSGIDDEDDPGTDPGTEPQPGHAIDDSDAVLPNTGGPSTWLLYLAVALLVVGGGFLVVGRRRSDDG